MGIREFVRATRPTFYFIGVTTGKSSIIKVFPEWAKFLGLRDVVIKGIDFKPHDEPDAYREAVEFIKNDPLSRGALVTTHKIDLLKACRDFFEELDPYARTMGEISCISKLKIRSPADLPLKRFCRPSTGSKRVPPLFCWVPVVLRSRSHPI
jgi:shikimate 5-dehydrogenase